MAAGDCMRNRRLTASVPGGRGKAIFFVAGKRADSPCKNTENAGKRLLFLVIASDSAVGGGEGARLFAEEVLALFCRAFGIAGRLGLENALGHGGRYRWILMMEVLFNRIEW